MIMIIFFVCDARLETFFDVGGAGRQEHNRIEKNREEKKPTPNTFSLIVFRSRSILR